MLSKVNAMTLTIDGTDVRFDVQVIEGCLDPVMVWAHSDSESEIRSLDVAMRVAGGHSSWTWDDNESKWVVVAFFEDVPGIAHFAA